MNLREAIKARLKSISRAALLKDDMEKLLVLQSIAIESYRRSHRFRPSSLKDLEYKVFSQFGDDGILAYLTRNIPRSHRRFIEFGVETYHESNTRLLLLREYWSGLVIDGNKKYVDEIKRHPHFWTRDLTAINAFVTKENISSILLENAYTKNIGVLSIDIDGNDFWIWQALEHVQPLIVVCEYNGLFGKELPVSTPYTENFIRTNAHPSNLYFGASINALVWLGETKGYRFVGCNQAGNNAYFCRNDFDPGIECTTISEGYIFPSFREARAPNGRLLLEPQRDALRQIKDLPLVNVRTHERLAVREATAILENCE